MSFKQHSAHAQNGLPMKGSPTGAAFCAARFVRAVLLAPDSLPSAYGTTKQYAS